MKSGAIFWSDAFLSGNGTGGCAAESGCLLCEDIREDCALDDSI